MAKSGISSKSTLHIHSHTLDKNVKNLNITKNCLFQDQRSQRDGHGRVALFYYKYLIWKILEIMHCLYGVVVFYTHIGIHRNCTHKANTRNKQTNLNSSLSIHPSLNNTKIWIILILIKKKSLLNTV